MVFVVLKRRKTTNKAFKRETRSLKGCQDHLRNSPAVTKSCTMKSHIVGEIKAHLVFLESRRPIYCCDK